ncbi:MAG: hypothetical protein RBS05_04065 [Zoogloea oleivorans]|jgi:hypothetical protein|uniref:hypothetical protein n=1 Tax=Zoogloea oleivorans TaxID=1552750 RepID=UPI002A36AE65|nr:hypothetical protein [Zoogloea oleivorans]MDY0035066.1 hypothetical protein [Zoogloea oleivorans]
MATTDLEVVHTSLDSPEEDEAWTRVNVKGMELMGHRLKWHRSTMQKAAEVEQIQDEPAIKALIESWPKVYGVK